MREKFFFHFPDDGEMYLAALASVQSLIESSYRRDKDCEIEAHVFGQTWWEFLLREPIRSFNTYEPIDWDLSVCLDRGDMYQRSLTTKKHAAQMFGLHVGSEPGLPDVSHLVGETKYDVCLLQWDGRAVLEELVETNWPEARLTNFDYIPDMIGAVVGECDYYEERAKLVCASRMVVGPRSFETYLAAAAGKSVVEIYPDSQHENWLSKWENPRYEMIYGKIEQIHPTLVWRLMAKQWKTIQSVPEIATVR